VGRMVGMVGNIVGLEVGIGVGNTVGLVVGVRVGAVVGSAVGPGVGQGCALHFCSWPSFGHGFPPFAAYVRSFPTRCRTPPKQDAVHSLH
jgi:hypothetical protein